MDKLLYSLCNRCILPLVAFALAGRLIIHSSFHWTGVVFLVCSYLALWILIVSQTARVFSKRKTLCMIDLEIYSAFRCFFTRFFTALPQKESLQRPAILFLHGMLGNGQNGRFLLKQLSRFGNVYAIDMGTDNETAYQVSYEKEIERCALLVSEKIEQILAAGQKKIVLIGHSRGGVVANYLATTLLEEHIPLVITLGTPLQHPDRNDQVAEFINGLNEMLASNTATKFLHLWPEGDLVTKKESSFPKEAQQMERIKIKHSGHLSILFSEEAVEKISDALSCALDDQRRHLAAPR